MAMKAGQVGVFQVTEHQFSQHFNLFKCAVIRDVSWLALSQWETSFQRNAVSHWLGANLESALIMIKYGDIDFTCPFVLISLFLCRVVLCWEINNSSFLEILVLGVLTHLMLEMECYSCFFFCQNNACWYPGFLSRQGISSHGINNVG